MKKLFIGALLVGLSSHSLAGAASQITVKGSDTMVILSQKWAEVFMKKNPGVKISITGGGTGTGVAALLNNTTHFANASRPLKPQEIAQIKAKKKTLTEFKVAMDALAVVVNTKAMPVKSLSVRQLMGIYTGQVKDWREVGGKPGKIVRYCREANSGTYDYFKEHVLAKKDFAADCQTMAGTAAVAEAVARDPRGIGFGGVAYFGKRKDVKVLPLSMAPGKPPVTVLNGPKILFDKIWNRQYPISRYLYIYRAGPLTADEKKFMNFILSPVGQQIVVATEYIPLPKKK